VIISLLEPKLPGNDSRFAKAPQSRASSHQGDRKNCQADRD
jgi:hypothetical protein